ncbi:DUF86 domain-containing protein [Candidatus Woesearchaeota archaeon]|nr:DUF86 domain-containing protein [Candidatus Woesearchaeota archaeon]
MNRQKDKIQEIEKFLEELESILPLDFEEYKTDFKIRAICERYFEKIIEAVVDLAFIIIKENGFKSPEDDKKAFDILTEEKIISKNLAENLKDAKGMRNIIAHEYGQIDDKIVFKAITEELVNDVKKLIKQIVA